MGRTRWLIGYLDEAECAKHMLRRAWTWSTTLYWDRPTISRATAIRIARERGCPLPPRYGGVLIWYPVWPRNGRDGKPLRRGAGSVHETGKFD